MPLNVFDSNWKTRVVKTIAEEMERLGEALVKGNITGKNPAQIGMAYKNVTGKLAGLTYALEAIQKAEDELNQAEGRRQPNERVA